MNGIGRKQSVTNAARCHYCSEALLPGAVRCPLCLRAADGTDSGDGADVYEIPDDDVRCAFTASRPRETPTTSTRG
jgi:hypothetical protein